MFYIIKSIHDEAVRSIREDFNFSMCLSIFKHILSGSYTMDLITKNFNSIEKMINFVYYKKFKSQFEYMRIEFEDYQGFAYEHLVTDLHNYKPEMGKFTSYTLELLTNRAKDLFRNSKRDKRVINYQVDSFEQIVPGTDNLTIGDCITDSRDESDAARFLHYFDSLSPMQQKIIALMGWGYHQSEILECLNVSSGQYKSLMNDLSSNLKRKQYFGKEK